MLIPELAGLTRPRWRPHVPALWRDESTIQLGDDVIVDRVSPEQAHWLRQLDGSRSAEQLCADLPIAVAEARRLVRCLKAAGALIDAARMPQVMRFGSVAARDLTAQRWDAAVDHHRDPTCALRAMDARDAMAVAITGVGPLRDALAVALAAAGLSEVAVTTKAGCVLLGSIVHPDVPDHVQAQDLDVPHLHVGVRGDRAIVGPLVIPGVTGCLRCAHLHRRDRDRAWPLLAVQWSQLSADATQADPLIVQLAAVHAVHLIRTWIDEPERPELWAEVAVELKLAWLGGRVIARKPHPLCGCRWPAA
jgi:bacteriocin biosynthesis cyclodehydratase domain-containing protein